MRGRTRIGALPASSSSPIRIIRPSRLATLWNIDPSTVWRWVKGGVLPPPIQIGPGIKGWREDDLKALLERRRGEAQE